MLLFSLVHAIWTGWHAPLSAWIAPVGGLLVLGGAWSLAARRPLPRWAYVVLVVCAAVLATALVWAAVILAHDAPRQV